MRVAGGGVWSTLTLPVVVVAAVAVVVGARVVV